MNGIKNWNRVSAVYSIISIGTTGGYIAITFVNCRTLVTLTSRSKAYNFPMFDEVVALVRLHGGAHNDEA